MMKGEIRVAEKYWPSYSHPDIERGDIFYVLKRTPAATKVLILNNMTPRLPPEHFIVRYSELIYSTERADGLCDGSEEL